MNQPYTYTVIKKSHKTLTCPKCDGAGAIKKHFRSSVFVKDCIKCNGEGVIKYTFDKEVSLIEALEDINSINQQ